MHHPSLKNKSMSLGYNLRIIWLCVSVSVSTLSCWWKSSTLKEKQRSRMLWRNPSKSSTRFVSFNDHGSKNTVKANNKPNVKDPLFSFGKSLLLMRCLCCCFFMQLVTSVQPKMFVCVCRPGWTGRAACATRPSCWSQMEPWRTLSRSSRSSTGPTAGWETPIHQWRQPEELDMFDLIWAHQM